MKTFIIAEAGINHNGDFNLATKLIDAAVEAKVDAVKFQAFKSKKIISAKAPTASYQRTKINVINSQLEMAKKLELSFEDFEKLKDYCDLKKIKFLTTAFDIESADFIDHLVDIYKIPSGEITNIQLVKHIAKKNKPIILSTGMSSIGEVETAIEVIKKFQSSISNQFPALTLLHCSSCYPAAYEDVNLNAMLTLKNTFKCPSGYSDHTLGTDVAIAAVALGATMIEKHFTLNKNFEGPDHKASLEPRELKSMVASIRIVETALGDGIKKRVHREIEISQVARRSLIATKAIKAGTVLNDNMVSIKRPGTGISPYDLPKILGMTLVKDKAEDEVITWDDFKK